MEKKNFIQILKKYGIEESDIEQEILSQIKEGKCFQDDESLERIARFTKTNLDMQIKGLQPLTLTGTQVYDKYDTMNCSNIVHFLNQETNNIAHVNNEKYKEFQDKRRYQTFTTKDEYDELRRPLWDYIIEKASQLSKEEIQSALNVGLNAKEYIVVKGNYGSFMNLNIDESTYDNLMSKIKSYKMKKTFREKNIDIEKYLKHRLLLMAQKRLRYPECIASLQNIYFQNIMFLRAISKNKKSINKVNAEGFIP